MSESKNNISDSSNFERTEVLEDEYIVEKILDRKKINGVIKYKIKWEGYDENDCTWEPRQNLENVNYLIEEFDNKIKEKEKSNKIEKEKKLLTNKTNRSVNYRNNNINNSSIKDDDENSKSNNNNSERRSNNGFGILHRQTFTNIKNEENVENIINDNLDLQENKSKKIENYNIINGNNLNKNNNKPKENENHWKSPRGTLDTDIPLKIINAKILDDSDININCLIKWKPRSDSFVPEPEWISSKILKRICPDILFNFYESRIKFPKKDK